MYTTKFKTKKAAKRAAYYYLQAWATSTGGKAELVIKAASHDQLEDMLEHLWDHYYDEKKDYKLDDLYLTVKRPK